MQGRKAVVWVTILCAGVVVLGCSSGSEYPIAPVSGTVTLDGDPLADATVSFEPTAKGEGAQAGEPSVGKTGADGSYTLKTVSDQEGAVVGNHRVRITTAQWSSAGEEVDDPSAMEVEKETLPPRYNKETELTFDVPAEGTDAANFDLNSGR